MTVRAVIVAALFASAAAAQEPWPAKRYNPQAADDDLVLPMPCQGAMVFRKIETPHGGNALADLPITIGGEADKFAYLRGPRQDYISGNFGDGVTTLRHYYIGKYEVATAQYSAVMEGDCPKRAPRKSGFVAASEMSWFDAVEFGRRYTEFLWREHPGLIPMSGDARAFVRLPTEVEWEYAARGGSAVDEIEFRASRMALDDLEPPEYAAYGGSESANGVVQPIGARAPNRLLVHDMLGNVGEIVLEPFRLNRHGRLHGLSGAYIVKGGDARTPLDRLTVGARDETPFFNPETAAASASRYTGFRVVLSAMAVSDEDREQALREDYVRLAAEDPSLSSGKKSAEAQRLLNEAVDQATDEERDRLAAQVGEINRLLAEAQAERNEQRDQALRNQILASGVMCGQLELLIGGLSGQKIAFEQATIDAEDVCRAEPALCAEAKGILENMLKRIDGTETRIQRQISYYGSMIEGLSANYGQSLVDESASLLRRTRAARGDDDIAHCLVKARAHVSLWRENGVIDADRLRADLSP